MTTKTNSGTVSVSLELLPCPFCGSSDVKIVTDDGIHFAQCCKCEATGPTGFKRGEEDDADWNTRAQPADQQGEPFFYALCGADGKPHFDDFCVASEAHHLECEEEGVTVVPVYLHAQPATAKVVLPEREVLRGIFAQVIGGDAYDCTRVWAAWGVGTMSEEDFVPIVDQEERLYELVDACLDEVAKLNGEKL